MIQPLDLVETPNGGLALVTEMSPASDNYKVNSYSLDFLPGRKRTGDYNAWWEESKLTYVCSIPAMLAQAMAHPMGNNAETAFDLFDKRKP